MDDDEYIIKCDKLQIGMLILLRNNPCEIIKISHSHGKYNIKILIEGIHIFTNKKYEDIILKNYNIQLLNVKLNIYFVTNFNKFILLKAKQKSIKI